jgi:plasmid stability protein
MATLNVKNFPDGLYESLRERAKREHRSVAQEVIHLLERATAAPEVHSIRELRGLGKELWGDIDPVAHVDAERREWDP